MKAQIVYSYLFIEEIDFHRKEIVSDDVMLRLNHLVEDTFILTKTFKSIDKAEKAV